jgi:hypothetical protein
MAFFDGLATICVRAEHDRHTQLAAQCCPSGRGFVDEDKMIGSEWRSGMTDSRIQPVQSSKLFAPFPTVVYPEPPTPTSLSRSNSAYRTTWLRLNFAAADGKCMNFRVQIKFGAVGGANNQYAVLE